MDWKNPAQGSSTSTAAAPTTLALPSASGSCRNRRRCCRGARSRRNASLLLEVNRDATSDAARSPAELLAEVGLADFTEAYPHELSGGMQQRVALVRAMTLGAPLLLMDEPFAALDEITREEMRHLLARLCESLPTTVVFVTHSVPEAVYLSDRVVVLSQRPGRIVGIEPIDLPRPRRPDLEDDPAFYASTKRLRAMLHEGAALHWTPAV